MSIDYDVFRKKAVEWMIGRNWHQFTAKRNGFVQSLFDHSILEVDILLALLPILRQPNHYNLSLKEEMALLVGALGHDSGKERQAWQEYIHGLRGFESDINRELTDSIVPQLTKYFGLVGIDDDVKIIINQHMKRERTAANVMFDNITGSPSPRIKALADIIDTVDNFCSAKDLNSALQVLEKSILYPHLRITYHRVVLRGVSTSFVHRAAIDCFESRGWTPLLHYSYGTIYVTGGELELGEPSISEIQDELGKLIQNEFDQFEYGTLVVGKPTSSMMPKPEFFDYGEIQNYLKVAGSRIGRSSFRKKESSYREKVICAYFMNKFGREVSQVDEEVLEKESDRISRAYPEMLVFKFFKECINEKLLLRNGLLVEPEILQIIKEKHLKSLKTNDEMERVQKKIDQELKNAHRQFLDKIKEFIKTEYNKIYGEGGYEGLLSTSTFDPAKEMYLTVDRFWSLSGERFGLNVAKVELLPDVERLDLLIEILTKLAIEIYSNLPVDKRPTRMSGQEFAQAFIKDIIHPVSYRKIEDIVQEQMNNYLFSKSFANKAEGSHLCPICNAAFDDGESAKADYLANPESYTNRAIAHGRTGNIVICDACKYEKYLQQALLDSKCEKMIVLFPRMNIANMAGQILVDKVKKIAQQVKIVMGGETSDPDNKLSFNLTNVIAKQLNELETHKLCPENILELITYRSKKDKREKSRKELVKQLRSIFEDSLEEANDTLGTEFSSWENFCEAVIRGEVRYNPVDDAKIAAFKLVPQMTIVCQTPNMILIPLTNPIAMKDDGDANAALRELFILILISLSLDSSAAIIGQGEIIDFDGSEGVVRIPKVASIHHLIYKYRQQKYFNTSVKGGLRKETDDRDWVDLWECEALLRAISAASQLTIETEYSERSNLYQILAAPTRGHILRRIEEKSERKSANFRHIQLLEMMKEVIV